MADLMTRISADDAQFQAGMQRVDGRLSSFANAMKRTSSAAKGLFTGFGAAGAIAQIGALVRQFVDLQDQIERNSGSLQRMGTEGVRAANDQINAIRGIKDAYASIGSSQTARQKAVAEEAQKQIDEIGKMGLVGLVMRRIQTGETAMEALERIQAEANKAQNDIGRKGQGLTTAQKEADANAAEEANRERAAKIAARQNEVEQKFISDENRKGNARLSLADQLENRRLQMLRSHGRDREAELAEQAARSQKLRREIEGADYLSETDRQRALGELVKLDSAERQAIDQRVMSAAQSEARDGFQSVGVGGATFGQQMSLATQGVERSIKNIDANIEKAARDLNAVATRLNAPGYSLASYQD
jgi:hypothetical protein